MPEETNEIAEQFGTTAPTLVGLAIRAARKYAGVEDSMSDDEAFNAGFLTPEIIELFLALLQEVLGGCLPQQGRKAFARVRQFRMATSRSRVVDHLRLNWMSDRWFDRLGIARSRGDVVMARTALCSLCEDCDEEDVKNAQAEAMFLTI